MSIVEVYGFSLEMTVRDYECDLQGIVNNSVYMSYLEHARHEYLKQQGLDWPNAVREGINLVVAGRSSTIAFP